MNNIIFKPVKLTERLPDFSKNIFFYNSRTEGGAQIMEYSATESIPMKKGKLKNLKDIPDAHKLLLSSNTHWLEQIEININTNNNLNTISND